MSPFDYTFEYKSFKREMFTKNSVKKKETQQKSC